MNIDEKMWAASFHNFDVETTGSYIDLELASIDAGGFPVSWYQEGSYVAPYWNHTFLWWLELPRGLFYYNMTFGASLNVENPDDHPLVSGIRFQAYLSGINTELDDGNGDYDMWQVYGASSSPSERLYQDSFVTTSFSAQSFHSGVFPVKHSGDKFSIVVGQPFGNDLDGDLTGYGVNAHLALFRVKGLS